MRMIPIFILFASFASLASGCMTPGEKREMKKDLVEANARILQLEQMLNTSTKGGAEANKRVANTAAQLDILNRELQKVRGEIGILRIGVLTGQMPGLSEESAENSIASNLATIGGRVSELETAQEELLEAIKAAGVKKKSTKSKKSLTSVNNLEEAFEKKQYSYVVEDAPTILKKVSGGDKEQTMYLYAESLYKLGKVRDAALKFNEFIESRPSTKYLPEAKLRMGDSFRHLGDKDTAKLYYNELIREFPDSKEATAAKEKMAAIAR